jgi:hypothetical protein
MRIHVTAGWTPSNAATVWAVTEIGRSAQEEWANGGQADAILIDTTGRTVATAHADVIAGATSARLALTSRTLLAGEYQVQFRTKGGRATAASTDVVRVAVPPAPQATGAIFFRRGPATANRDVPTADLRFRRSDRLRVEVPSPNAATVAARLLDRTGTAMAVPVSATVRDDPDNSRWLSAEVALAPLAPGDYVVEIVAGTSRTLAAFRVIS